MRPNTIVLFDFTFLRWSEEPMYHVLQTAIMYMYTLRCLTLLFSVWNDETTS